MKQYLAREAYDSSCMLNGKQSIRCFSKKEFEKIQKSGGILAGSVNGQKKDYLGYVMYDEKQIPYPNLEYNRILYRPAGYICCSDETYLVILKRGKRLFMILLVILAILLAGGYYFLQERGPDLEPGLQQFKAAAGLPDGYGKTSFIIPAYNQIQMKAGTDEAGVALWNPDRNQVYFKFTIRLERDESTIYESKLVPPGMALRIIRFDRTFSKGQYPISIQVRTFDIKNYKQELNSGEVKTELIALEIKE